QRQTVASRVENTAAQTSGRTTGRRQSRNGRPTIIPQMSEFLDSRSRGTPTKLTSSATRGSNETTITNAEIIGLATEANELVRALDKHSGRTHECRQKALC